MSDLLPWEAPAVLDIDVATGTLGGCPSVYIAESTYTNSCNIGPLS